MSLRSREVTAFAIGQMPLLLPSEDLVGIVVAVSNAAIDYDDGGDDCDCVVVIPLRSATHRGIVLLLIHKVACT